MAWMLDKGDYIDLSIKVIPNASKNSIQGIINNVLKIRIHAPPVDGKANQCLIKYLSKTWNIKKLSFEILSGETNRNKHIRIHSPSNELKKTLRNIR